MRLTAFLTLIGAAAFASAAPPALSQPAPPASGSNATSPGAPPDPNDLLGNITVVAGAGGRPLPKIAIVPSLSSAAEDVTLRSVIRRDLDLSGEVEVLPDSAAPDGVYLTGSPVDTKAWAAKGVEAVVRVTGQSRDATHAELRAEVFLVAKGATAVFDKRFSISATKVREGSHRVADRVIGALTGQDGGFASHLTFASGTSGYRRIFTIDADGHDAQSISPVGVSTVGPAFTPQGTPVFGGATGGAPYRLMGADGAVLPMSVEGSVYSVAFAKKPPAGGASVAVSVGVGNDVRLFSGPSLMALKPASEVKMALHPSFTPSGKLVFSGEGRYGQRIFVDGKAVTPEGLFASSPAICNSPDGTRIVFAAGVGKDSDLATTGEGGGALARLTQGAARNSYPACSPDGRLVAFFSTRQTGGGPGLYVMRLDGSRPKLVAPLTGDSLRWDALPPGDMVELPS